VRLPRSLRARLTLAFVGLAAAVVLAVALGTAHLVDEAVWGPFDAALEEEAETLATLMGVGDAADLDRAVGAIGREKNLGPQKFVRLLGSDGRPLVTWGTIPRVVRATPLPAEGAVRRSSIRSGDASYRVVTHPAPGGAWSEVGVVPAAQASTIQRVHLAIAAAAACLLVLLTALAWTVTTRATAEIGRLAAELETIEAGSLDRRLATRHTTEVDRLAGVLNRMLGRLDGAVGHLRRFTADAAHELRTPLAVLRAQLEVAIGRARSPEKDADALLDALEQTERLERLADDLLTLSAVEAGVGRAGARVERVRLDDVVKEVAEFVEPVAQEQGRAFVCEVPAPVTVRGTTYLLKRVVLNLVDNALRHTPPGVRVRLAIGSRDGMATIEVEDGGPGIPSDELPLVFERFHRGPGSAGGTGLGLALCREIVARLGGRIALESTPAAGTTVRVALPLASADRAA
jgi:two-component system sensor histidine kinase TctE